MHVWQRSCLSHIELQWNISLWLCPKFQLRAFTQLSRICPKHIHQKISDFVSMFPFIVFKIKNLCIICIFWSNEIKYFASQIWVCGDICLWIIHLSWKQAKLFEIISCSDFSHLYFKILHQRWLQIYKRWVLMYLFSLC